MDEFPNSIPHPKLREIYRYWDKKRGSRRMPSRADIDPSEIPALLPQITLIDVERAPMRFRYRLFGTGLARDRGDDLSGRYLDEPGLYAEPESMRTYLLEIATTGKPAFMVGERLQQEGKFGVLCRIGLPLSSDGETVDMIFGASYRIPSE